MNGGSLRDCLDKQREAASWKWRLQCAHDIAAGLQFLHSKCFVHRDVKTENVLLDKTGRAKVGRFWNESRN